MARFTGKAAYLLSSYSVVLGGRQWGFSVLVTGEVSRVRLCRDHGEIFFWLSLLRALVWVVYDAGSPGGCSGGAGSCDPIQISVHVGACGADCSPDGVGG